MLSLNFGTELSAANLHFTHIITFDFISSLACTAKQLCTLHYTKTVPSSKANNCWLVVAKNTMLANNDTNEVVDFGLFDIHFF